MTRDIPARTPAKIAEIGEGASGWQPIETAPKDGTGVLAYGPDLGEASEWPGIYRAFEILYWKNDDWRTADGAPQGDITHWMPLPSPPSPEELK